MSTNQCRCFMIQKPPTDKQGYMLHCRSQSVARFLPGERWPLLAYSVSESGSSAISLWEQREAGKADASREPQPGFVWQLH
jgi:hypothetical protein